MAVLINEILPTDDAGPTWDAVAMLYMTVYQVDAFDEGVGVGKPGSELLDDDGVVQDRRQEKAGRQ